MFELVLVGERRRKETGVEEMRCSGKKRLFK